MQYYSLAEGLRPLEEGLPTAETGILAVLAAGWVEPLMPWLLSFAAGAMVYVVAQELIPEARRDETSRAGTWGVLLGFVIMMVMDVALG